MRAAAVGCLAAALVLTVGTSGVSAYNNGVGRLPAMGWNTWCTDDLCGLVDLCFEGEVKSVADAMVAQGLTKLGYEYINLDDCWADTKRDANGNLQPNPTQFPSGMKALADYVHGLGLKLGLYTDVGTSTCKWGRPGAYGHYVQDANTLAGWGIDFVKADNCHRVGTDSELYANYSAALNATGRPILFSLCNWGIENVESWGPVVGQQYRFQMDHLPLWEWPPLAEGVGFGQGTKNIIEFMATLDSAKSSGPYGYMDPDFAETMMPLTLPFTESRTEWSFWCLWSSPLLVATDIRNLTAQPEKASIITNPEPIAIDQDEWGRAGHRIFNNSDGAQFWIKPLSNGDTAAILYNSGDAEVNVNTTWSQWGFAADAQVKVRDVWRRQDLGVFANAFSASVKPHDVLFVRATVVGGSVKEEVLNGAEVMVDTNDAIVRADADADADEADVDAAVAWKPLGPAVGAWNRL